MFEELEKDRTKKDDDFSKAFDIQSPFVSSASSSSNAKNGNNRNSAPPLTLLLQRNVGVVTLLNFVFFASALFLFLQSSKHYNNNTAPVTMSDTTSTQLMSTVNTIVSSSSSSSSITGGNQAGIDYDNMESLPPCDDPEWCSIPMPQVSYFKFDPPTDQKRWRIAQIQAATGEQVLLREVIKAFPTHFDYLDGDITFRRLHYAMDMFVDERRDLTPLTSAGRRQSSYELEDGKSSAVTQSGDVPEGNSGGRSISRRLEQVKITSPKEVNGKLVYPWELEGKHVIPEPYDFRYAERAPVISIGYTAYLKESDGYYSGSRVGGAFIDRGVFFKHWRKAKDRIEVPFIAVCSLNENWGFLSTMFPNRTAGWGRCCDKPQDKILYDFLDHEKTLMLVSNQHTNVTHPKLLILPRGIPLTWGNTRILVWDSQRLVLKKHKKNKLLFAAASKWGPRPQILACISNKFTGQQFDGHVKNPPQQRLDRAEYYVKLAQARFGVGLPGLGYDTFRYVFTIFC